MMSEAVLTPEEYWFISVYFRKHGFRRAHSIAQIGMYMLGTSFAETDDVIASLIEKKVLSPSHDGFRVKFTDYGMELFEAMAREAEEWEQAPLVRVSVIDREQILIEAGQTFLANRVLREVLIRPRREVAIVDPYIGSEVFDLLEENCSEKTVRILTGDKVRAGARTSYRSFHEQYPSTEMRYVAQGMLHDRFILWDGASGVHFGHSLKDLGKRDTQVTFLQSAVEQWKNFETRWRSASSIGKR